MDPLFDLLDIQQYWHNKWENGGPGTESNVHVIFVPPQLIDKA